MKKKLKEYQESAETIEIENERLKVEINVLKENEFKLISQKSEEETNCKKIKAILKEKDNEIDRLNSKLESGDYSS
jgi:hypothetical protein